MLFWSFVLFNFFYVSFLLSPHPPLPIFDILRFGRGNVYFKFSLEENEEITKLYEIQAAFNDYNNSG